MNDIIHNIQIICHFFVKLIFNYIFYCFRETLNFSPLFLTESHCWEEFLFIQKFFFQKFLSSIPCIPSISSISSILSIPSIPNILSILSILSIPSIPSVPSIPFYFEILSHILQNPSNFPSMVGPFYLNN